MDKFKSNREVWVDYAKAIGIILVIAGHLRLAKPISDFIYAFHVPLFFILSGYLYKSKDTFKTVISKDVRRLLLPYTYFYMISYGYWFLTGYLRHRNEYPGTSGVEERLLGLVVGVGYETHVSISISPHLWFLMGLFFVKFFYSLLQYISKENKLLITAGIIVLLITVVFINSSGYDLWLSLDSAVLSLPFFFIGVLLKSYRKWQLWFKNNLLNLFYLLLTIAATWYLSIYNGSANINTSYFGHNLLLFYITGLCGSLMIFSLSFILAVVPSKIVVFVSNNTLILLCIHGLIIIILRSIGLITNTQMNLLQATTTTLFILVLSVPAIYIITNYLPFLIGEKTTKPLRIKSLLVKESKYPV
jgi:acyltransferase